MTLALLIEERDELLRERKLLVEVAKAALWVQESLDSLAALVQPPLRSRDKLRAALEAWTSDEASKRGEDE